MCWGRGSAPAEEAKEECPLPELAEATAAESVEEERLLMDLAGFVVESEEECSLLDLAEAITYEDIAGEECSAMGMAEFVEKAKEECFQP